MKSLRRMELGNVGISARAKFLLYYLENNGFADLENKTIFIGKKVLSLEVLIHEINELESENILLKFGIENIAVRYMVVHGKVKILPKDGYDEGQRWNGFLHLVCPYGFDSLIYPSTEKTRYKSLLRTESIRSN